MTQKKRSVDYNFLTQSAWFLSQKATQRQIVKLIGFVWSADEEDA